MKIASRAAAVAVCGAVLLSGCQAETSGQPASDNPTVARTMLRHVAVERYIDHTYDVHGVICHGGTDIPVRTGDEFACQNATRAFAVRLTDDAGTYEVSPK